MEETKKTASIPLSLENKLSIKGICDEHKIYYQDWEHGLIFYEKNLSRLMELINELTKTKINILQTSGSNKFGW